MITERPGRSLHVILVVGLLFTLLRPMPAVGGPIAYVDDSAAPDGDGISWVTAFDDLQDALDAVGGIVVITEIWVATGSYRPSVPTLVEEPRSKAFQLLNDVSIYGGFAGNESEADQRDPSVNFTILSGDIGLPGVSSDDAYHVVIAGGTDATAVLDGFIITGGNADGVFLPDTDDGGGLHTFDGSPTIVDCGFAGNFCDSSGGAVYVLGGSPSFLQCAFSGNSSDGLAGAIFNSGDIELIGCDFTFNTAETGGAISSLGSVTMTDCTFLFNTATVDLGGAIHSGDGGQATLVNCLFLANDAVSLGGGLYTSAGVGQTASLTGCAFSGNTAFDGGGLYAAQTSPSITDCLFVDNFASRYGGGLYVTDGSPSLVGSTIDHNRATWFGAGAYVIGNGFLSVQQCDFTGNMAFGNFGGGLYLDGCTALIVDSEFSGNNADDYGAGLYSANGAAPTIEGCTFADNSVAYGAAAFADSTVIVTGCEFRDNFSAAGAALVNTGSTVSTISDCLFIENTVSSNGGAVSNDMNSQSTFTNCTFESNSQGAMRCIGPTSLTMVIDSTFTNNSTTNFGGAIVVTGGHLDVSGSCFFGNTASYAGAIQITSGSATILDSVFTGNSAASDGGAVVVANNAGATVSGCTFEQNTAGASGGAMIAGEGSVIDSVFNDNTAQMNGGAMSFRIEEPAVVRCTFSGNTANRGGAVNIDPGSNSGGTSTFTSCAFLGNAANTDGGALFSVEPSTTPLLVNCLFSGNTCGGNGAGIHIEQSSPTLINCTVTGNTAVGSGGGMYSLIFAGAEPVVSNCILWGNTDAAGMIETSQVFEVNGASTINYSDIQGLTGILGGVGNIGSDPLFADAAGPDGMTGTGDDDLHLLVSSPCIDAANNIAVPVGITTDLDGNPRFVDDPNTPDCPQAPGTCGDPPVVDMGAYEFQTLPCPWDCDSGESIDGTVGIVDFLALLAQWGGPGPCDFDGGGVGITDFLELLANWGPCP